MSRMLAVCATLAIAALGATEKVRAADAFHSWRAQREKESKILQNPLLEPKKHEET